MIDYDSAVISENETWLYNVYQGGVERHLLWCIRYIIEKEE